MKAFKLTVCFCFCASLFGKTWVIAPSFTVSEPILVADSRIEVVLTSDFLDDNGKRLQFVALSQSDNGLRRVIVDDVMKKAAEFVRVAAPGRHLVSLALIEQPAGHVVKAVFELSPRD